MKPPVVVLLVLSGWLLSGCAPAANQGGFDSDNPAAKLYAIRQAGQSGDVRYVPRLVEELESDDPAVRMMAIHALEQLTGQRLGYNPYAAEAQRKPAVDAWVRAARDGWYKKVQRGEAVASPVVP